MLPAILGAVRAATGLAGMSGRAAGLLSGGAGRAVSGAFEGDTKKMTDGLEKMGVALRPAIKDMNSFAATTFNMQLAAQGLSSLGKVIVNLPSAPIHVFTAAINTIQAPVLAVVQALKGFVGAVGAIGSAVSDFVKLSSPIHVVRFNLAMDDLMAVIGQGMVPLIEMSTKMVRSFADAISLISKPVASFLDLAMKPLMGVFSAALAVVAPMTTLFNHVLGLIGQFIRPLTTVVSMLAKMFLFPAELMFSALATVLESLGGPITTIVSLFGAMLDALAGVVDGIMKYIRDLFGIRSAEGRSVGAAVRPATIGSVEDYGRKAQQAAFSLGTAADPARESSMTLKEILSEIRSWPGQIPGWIEETAKKIAAAITGKAEAVAKDVGDAGRDAGRWLGRRKDDVEEAADDASKWFRRNNPFG